MDPRILSRALARNPNINVPRPPLKRPERTEVLYRRPMGTQEPSAPYDRDISLTQRRNWLPRRRREAPWWELHPKWVPSKPIGRLRPPPSTTAAPDKTKKAIEPREWGKMEEGDDELEDIQDELKQSDKPEASKKRGRREAGEDDAHGEAEKQTKRQKLDKGKEREILKHPKRSREFQTRVPGVLPLSPQDARAPRPENPDTDARRREFPGPGTYEYRWKENPRVDEDEKIRNSINGFAVPQIKEMPVGKPEDAKLIRPFQYMGDQAFWSLKVPDDGNCFFGAVSTALYGTSKFWHLVKYEHLYFFRYVLTHPAHPRYDFYWIMNTQRGTNNLNIWQQLSIPGAWQSSDLFSVTADIYNLFIILYEQLDRPEDLKKSQLKEDNQTIGLFGQYNATHKFFHLLGRNHYQPLLPRRNPEAQFPYPDSITIKPRPGRARQNPFGGRGRPIVPPPIAQPIIPIPKSLDLTRVLGFNTTLGSLELETVTRLIREERAAAQKENDPTSLKWWLERDQNAKKSTAGPSTKQAAVIEVIILDEEDDDAPVAPVKVPTKAAPVKGKASRVKATPVKEKVSRVKATPVKGKEARVKATPVKGKVSRVKATPVKGKADKTKGSIKASNP